MDAKRIAATVILCGTLSITGCSLFQPLTRPAGQQQTKPPNSRDPVIVRRSTTQPAAPSKTGALDPIEQRVMEYIERVERNGDSSARAAKLGLSSSAVSENETLSASTTLAPPTATGSSDAARVLVPQRHAARPRPTQANSRSEHPIRPSPKEDSAVLVADESPVPPATSDGASRESNQSTGDDSPLQNTEATSAAKSAAPHASDGKVHTPSDARLAELERASAATAHSRREDTPASGAVEPATHTPEPQPAAAEPPVIESVSIRAGAAAVQPTNSPAPVAPSINTPTRAAGAGPSARELLSAYVNDPEWRSDATFRRQLDAKLLAVIAGDVDTARKPLEMATDEQQALATRLVSALIAARDAHAGDPRASADRVLTELDALGDTLRKSTSLELPRLAICREVRGFGQFQPFEPAQFAAGQPSEFVLYCELRNFTSQQQSDGQFLSKFELRTTILHGKEPVLELVDRDITDRCRSPRRDCFIPRVVRLPATLAPGRYLAKVAVIDKLGDKVAEQTVEFRLNAQ